MRNRKGFTLTELLAVIAIMAILAVAAISGYSSMTKNSKQKAYESKVEEIENAALKFAKETNITTTTTISVNKLVVQGYFQPDEATTDGLASVNNPITSENMVCNLVSIIIQDDIYIAEYKENERDCAIADQELADADITVVARELDGDAIGNTITMTNNVTNWTGKDVVLVVSSTKYTDFVSVSYDFDGQTITKVKNTPSSSTTYVESDYNKIAIRDVRVMFNNDVVITYNLADGTSKSRTVKVRIDKEPPTSRPVVSNDVTTGSTKKVNLYLDDGNGSGVVGFYVSSMEGSYPESGYIDKDTNRPGKNNGDGKFNGYNSYFYGQQGTYYVKIVDAVGNVSESRPVIIANFEKSSKACTMSVKGLNGETWATDETWYNKPIRITGTTNNSVGTMGIKYVVKYANRVPTEPELIKYFNGQTNNGILSDYVDQSGESATRTYYLAMKGQGRDEEISYCTKSLGLDTTPPNVSITCKSNDCDTYKKTHQIRILLEDGLSGFYTSAFTIKIGWSASDTTHPTKWENLSGGAYLKNANGTNNEKKIEFITDLNKYASDAALTGKYYMWVKGDSFEDKAHNKGTSSPFAKGGDFPIEIPISYDNTPPTCTSSGGNNNWTNGSRTLKGTCVDDHSGCYKAANSGEYTYDNNGNLTRTINSEINSTTESPGELYDKAGNHITCPSNQTVRIDKSKPSCEAINKTTEYTSAGASYKVKCSDTGGSAVKTCGGSTDNPLAQSKIKSTKTYTVTDNANNSNTCEIKISEATFYSKSTRSWDSCLRCEPFEYCSGGTYCDTKECLIGQAVSAEWCAAEGGYIGTQISALGSGGTCYKECCATEPYCHDYDTAYCPNSTCEAGYTDWTGYGDWGTENSCGNVSSDLCVDKSEKRYKNS